MPPPGGRSIRRFGVSGNCPEADTAVSWRGSKVCSVAGVVLLVLRLGTDASNLSGGFVGMLGP